MVIETKTADGPFEACRPVIRGTHHMIVAGHYLAAQAGYAVLEAGGNAVDAGVAGGLALGVVHSDIVNIAGVAPIILFDAENGEVVTISGLGTWPSALTPELFARDHGGQIPEGVLRTVVPAAPDAWITALSRYGTMSFGEIARGAIDLARDGFAMYPLMAQVIASKAESYARWPSSAAIYLPNGAPPAVGARFVQADLARSLQYMADEEAAASARGRDAGLAAARAAFYTGDIAAEIVRFHRANGGLLSAADLAGFESAIEPPVSVPFDGLDIYTCGAWCQGPVLPQALRLLDAQTLRALGHNTPEMIHLCTEALKLAFADREHWYGDPRMVDVPMAGLLSADYARRRLRLIDPARAIPGMPPAGDPPRGLGMLGAPVAGAEPGAGEPSPSYDTSYVCVADKAGNLFSATPSDVSFDTPVVPGTGLCPSSRGSQSWADPAHPSSAAPGKRPRLTPNPALALGPDGFGMPFGTPGGDVQSQAMLQVLLNILVFGMNPQAAVEAPRYATLSFPNSFEPHDYRADLLQLEARLPEATGARLAALGHDVRWWPEWSWQAGAMCLIRKSGDRLEGAADPRRSAYALGR